jgi:hypothetical protein
MLLIPTALIVTSHFATTTGEDLLAMLLIVTALVS